MTGVRAVEAVGTRIKPPPVKRQTAEQFSGQRAHSAARLRALTFRSFNGPTRCKEGERISIQAATMKVVLTSLKAESAPHKQLPLVVAPYMTMR